MKRNSGASLIGLRTASRGPGLRRDDNAFAGMTGSGSDSRDGVPAFAGMTMLLMAVVIMMMAGCKPAPVKEAVKVEPVKVRVAPVVIQEISLPVRSGGIVATSEEIKLSFKTGGIVARTYVKEGDAVKQGQLLAVLNLSEINAQVNQAKNGYDKALRDYNRAKNLYVDSVATLEQMQNAETAMNVSKSVLDIAQFNQSHSKIVAPKSGVILRQLVKGNELVASGYPVYALGISGKNWIIRTALSDRDIVKVNIGDSASVVIDAWPGQPFTAVVSQIDESSNPMTGTYETELKLNENKNRLASGFIANIEIFPSRKVSYYLIPMASVVEADGRVGYVYEVTPTGTAKKVKVTIATLYGAQAAISGGLENVKEVVSEGVAYLTDGMPVDIKKQ
ncbi:MAG: efflux RND transporter periplasmic adaptor subunit [Porphyromonadaceae bacterium]|nr:MAG: efflux RND transporter periplasmic adaptor subunit [Porphyromonadaceae bacterium]